MKNSIESYLRYIGLKESEIEVLRSARTQIEAHATGFIDRFYGHLKAFEGTRAFLTQEDVVHRLLFAQRTYVHSLFDAQFDNAYFLNRQIIGQTHFRLGLDFKWYVGAYALYLDHFVPVLNAIFAPDSARLEIAQSAFRKVILMDMSIVLDAYHECDRAALEASKTQVLHQEKLATIGLLASGLAHEIGNPLASIQAVCDNQLRRKSDSITSEKFQRIRNQVVRIVEIVRKLVDYARPAPDVWHRINLNSEIEAALSIARLSRSAKSLTVDLHLTPELPPIQGLEGQMSQVFLNLFLNAIDAMCETDAVMTVTTRCDGTTVYAEVKDHGAGISEAHLARIFDPFFTTKDVGKGTGLGLHVSLGIVERHHGKMRVESVVGSGSTFTVELPVRQS